MLGYIVALQFITVILCAIFIKKNELHYIKISIPLSALINALISIIFFVLQINNPESSSYFVYKFLKIANIDCDFGILSDSLSITIVCVTCIIASMCNFYSMNYVRKNVGISFLVINIFPLLCTLFIISTNIFQIYVCIELMTFIVYFMTVFNRENYEAGIKIAKMHLLSSLIFLLSIIYVMYVFGSLSFSEINKFSIGNDLQMVSSEIASLLMIVAISIKSAFIFSKKWISNFAKNASIPSITIVQTSPYVAAGIFIIIRLQNIFECSEMIQDMLTVVGIFSSIFFAIKAVTSSDIKEIFVYSSSAQIGIMLIACGFASYGAAVILFVTFAFSNTLLFFCSGSVIYALSGEKNINKMGELQELLPRTYLSFVAAVASQTCFPLLSSYYSAKVFISDITSNSLYLSKYYLSAITAIIVSILISLCLVRAILKIFYGKSRLNEITLGYLDQGGNYMTNTLYVSIFFSIFSGVFFYYFAYTSIIWKDVFAFSCQQYTPAALFFSFSSIVGLFLATIIAPYIKTKNLLFKIHVSKMHFVKCNFFEVAKNFISKKFENFEIESLVKSFERVVTPKIGTALFVLLICLGLIKWN